MGRMTETFLIVLNSALVDNANTFAYEAVNHTKTAKLSATDPIFFNDAAPRV